MKMIAEATQIKSERNGARASQQTRELQSQVSNHGQQMETGNRPSKTRRGGRSRSKYRQNQQQSESSSSTATPMRQQNRNNRSRSRGRTPTRATNADGSLTAQARDQEFRRRFVRRAYHLAFCLEKGLPKPGKFCMNFAPGYGSCKCSDLHIRDCRFPSGVNGSNAFDEDVMEKHGVTQPKPRPRTPRNRTPRRQQPSTVKSELPSTQKQVPQMKQEQQH